MGQAALGEREGSLSPIYLSSGCCCRQWEVRRDKRYEVSTTLVPGLLVPDCVMPYSIRVSYEERGRERRGGGGGGGGI